MRLSICRALTTFIATLVLAVVPVCGQGSDGKLLEEAAVQLEEALKISPGDKEVAGRLVAVLRQLAAAAISNDPEKALAHLVRTKELAPADPDVLFEFAMAALRLTLHEDAARALVEAMARRPDEPKFLYALARARMGSGDLNEAERLFRRYTELHPEDATGHFGLGYVLAGLKRNEAARAAFERSLALRPEQTESNYQLGLLDMADGNHDAAVARFGKALARYRDHAGALLGMGRVYFIRKQYDAARQNLERVVELEPGQQQAHYYLSMTYARLGNKEAAAREAEISETLEREEKNRRRTILRLYEENVRPKTGRKP
jgi:tetratricopeptide (TPR) repeat protein